MYIMLNYNISRIRRVRKFSLQLAFALAGSPAGLASWRDIALVPRELAARLYNVQRYTVFAKGGHFPAWEQPILYAEDLRQFQRTVHA